MEKQPEEIRFVQLDVLHLDKKNPRLPSFISDKDEQTIIDYIADSTSIEELASAIAENGYFPGEPLIVVPDDGKDGEYVVVEGNRRLTALRLLQNPKSWSTPSARILDIVERATEKPTEIPVVIKSNREEVLPYLGYRHITGIKEWGPLAKARYMDQLFERTNSRDETADRYREVASTIGSRRDHIKRNLEALAVYKVIEESDFYDIDGLDEETIKFAVLSTALANPRIGRFVGLANDDGNVSEINSENFNFDHIREITEWLYKKDEKGKTRVGESRNLPQLAAVVDSQVALAALRSGASLSVAYQQTADINQDFLGALYRSEVAILEAVTLVANVEFSQQAADVAQRVRENINLIRAALKEKLLRDDDD